MAYSTISDLQNYVGPTELLELCTTDSTKTATDAEVTGPVNEAIESADAEIDMYLLARWPGLRSLAAVPPVINNFSATLAIFSLYEKRRKVPPGWAGKAARVRELLEKANSGELVLPETSTGTVETETTDRFVTDALDNDDDLNDSDRRVYTKDTLYRLTGTYHRAEDE